MMIRVPRSLPWQSCVARAAPERSGKRLLSTGPKPERVRLEKLEEFKEVEHMLRPPKEEKLSIMEYRKKHFRVSRWKSYDFDFNFKNTNKSVLGDQPSTFRDYSWVYRLTIMRGNPRTRTERGEKAISLAHELLEGGKGPDARWLNKAMYDADNAHQLGQLFAIGEKLNIIDAKLISTLIFNMAKKQAANEAVELYEGFLKQQDKVQLDAQAHASAIEAYGKAGKGDKALEIYESLKKEHGLGSMPQRAHSSLMQYYFDNGLLQKGFQVFEEAEKGGVKPDVGILTTVIRGCRHNGSTEKAQAAFDRIKRDGLKPDAHAHEELVLAYAKVKDIEGMTRKIEEMKDSGFRPNCAIYNAIVKTMIRAGEHNNALMALDMQFKERAWPLDKGNIVMLARHFAFWEGGLRVKPKTEYAIWAGRKSGTYTDDLKYLTTMHHYLMLPEERDYYFRHHPEYDYPDKLKRPYQFKDYDEYPVYFPEDDRRPAAQKMKNYHANPNRTFIAGLPDRDPPYNLKLPRDKELDLEPAEVAESPQEMLKQEGLSPSRIRYLVQQARLEHAEQLACGDYGWRTPTSFNESLLKGMTLSTLTTLHKSLSQVRREIEVFKKTPEDMSQIDVAALRGRLPQLIKQVATHYADRKQSGALEAEREFELEEEVVNPEVLEPALPIDPEEGLESEEGEEGEVSLEAKEELEDDDVVAEPEEGDKAEALVREIMSKDEEEVQI